MSCERVIAPEIEDLTKALKICATEEPQERYPCEECYLYPLSKDGHMSTGRTCFEHLALDVVEALTRLNDFTTSQCAKLLEKLGRVEKERDAAVDALAHERRCEDCKHIGQRTPLGYINRYGEPCRSCTESFSRPKWQWRGSEVTNEN